MNLSSKISDRVLISQGIQEGHLDQDCVLGGWVDSLRHLGQICFLRLRDHTGVVQLVMEKTSASFSLFSRLKLESVILVQGKVQLRKNPDPLQDLGNFEVWVSSFEVLSSSQTLPFQLADAPQLSDQLSARYRFLYLRQKALQENLRFRHDVFFWLRERFHKRGFLEVQTPILTATSPEGARDFLVPSRKHLGKFYALPQSPQVFKQLLMSSGVGSYFQLAPCFRDEDARSDRLVGEFYQLDVERSFVTKEHIQEDLYELFSDLFQTFGEDSFSFSHLSYESCLFKYGIDKPNLAFSKAWEKAEWVGESSFPPAMEFPKKNEVLLVPFKSFPARKVWDQITHDLQGKGWPGFPHLLIDWEKEDVKGSLKKFFPFDWIKSFLKREEDPFTLMVLRTPHLPESYKAVVRDLLLESFPFLRKPGFYFLFVDCFPMFEWVEEAKSWDFVHNPFSHVLTEDILNTPHEQIFSQQYDLVCNGYELLSGAIRNHSFEKLVQVFQKIGYDQTFVEEKFRGLSTAFQHGTPPHGGYAAGMERILMLLRGEKNLRNIVAFPLTQQASDPLCGAPSEPALNQLKELGLK